MAGAFTHMAIVAEAAKSFPPGKKFGDIIHENLNFLTLGTVSPDIPYLAFLKLSGFNWADVMHYFQTNGIVRNGMHSLAAAKNKDTNWECQIAWLAGFVGHLVGDATIHPIIESIAGPYTNPDSHNRHGESEMIQDVLIFKDVKNLAVSAADYTDLIDDCRKNASYTQVTNFWDAHALVNCPFDMSFDAAGFIKSYFDIIALASSGNQLAAAFRHMGIKYIYRTYEDITINSPDLVKQYYSEIPLPNGLTGSFRKDGFDYAVKNLIAIWSKIDRFLFSTDNIVDIVPNWNLDTGVDQTTGIRTYWS
jgi:Zinc dependent phospholipase C